jgi:hypothetical protein
MISLVMINDSASCSTRQFEKIETVDDNWVYFLSMGENTKENTNFLWSVLTRKLSDLNPTFRFHTIANRLLVPKKWPCAKFLML